MEYYGNGITAVILEPLNKYPQIDYDPGEDSDPIMYPEKHFEFMMYPAVLAAFINVSGPRYTEKLIMNDICGGGTTYDEVREATFAKSKVFELAKQPIKIKLKELMEADKWVEHSFDQASKIPFDLFIRRVYLALDTLRYHPSGKNVFKHTLLNVYAEYRLKELTMIQKSQVMLTDYLLVDAIIR